MSTPIGAATSRPFKVVDTEQFFHSVNGIEGLVAEEVTGDDGLAHVVVWADDGFWPQGGDPDQKEIFDVVAENLPVGEYAVFEEVSMQGPTSVRAGVIVVSHTGAVQQCTLDDMAQQTIAQMALLDARAQEPD